MMGSVDELPSEPSEKPVFMEDMTDQQLASAVSTPYGALFVREHGSSHLLECS